MSNELSRLWVSTENLHKRFYPNDYPSFEAQHRVFIEEMGEFIFAIHFHYKENTISEAVDMLVTAMGLLQGLGVTLDELEGVMGRVALNNDRKTLESHEVRADGKISRRKG